MPKSTKHSRFHTFHSIKNYRHFNKASAGVGITIFAIVGTILLFRSHAATPFASIEPEQGAKTPNAVTVNDLSASGGSAVKFGATVAPPGTMPTAINTGPTTNPTNSITADQFLASKTCNNQRITSPINMGTNGLGEYTGVTFTLINCVIEQGWIWNDDSFSYPLSQYPTINMSYTTIDSSFAWGLAFKGTWDHIKVTDGWQLAACGSCALTDYGVTRDLPFTVTNSYITAPPIPASTGCQYHSEAFHGIGGASNYKFINTRFVQEGTGNDPFAYCHTGTIYQQGGGGVIYDGCYFDDGASGQQQTYFYTINIDGSGGAGANVVKNSYIENSGAYGINPAGGAPATYTNNFDFNTKQPITIP